ncbi:integrase [Streptomyces sp. NPDC054786]
MAGLVAWYSLNHIPDDEIGSAFTQDGRPHDARHTEGTVLPLLGVPDVVVDAILVWRPGGAVRVCARDRHITGPILRKVARQIGDALRAPPEAG